MEKFDIRTAKLASIIILILFVFVMVVANAYKYLPGEDVNLPEVNTQVNLPVDDEESNIQKEENTQEESADERKTVTEEDKENMKSMLDKISPEEPKNDLIPLENINEGEGAVISETPETYESVLSNARVLKSDKQFVKALAEFQRAEVLSSSNKEKAVCYEEISVIYALAKKYGTALSFAHRAYNLSPSTSREILLARLYFKTGDIERATERINNVLRRDFNFDN